MSKHFVGSIFGLYVFMLCSNSYAQTVLPEVSVADSSAIRRAYLSTSSLVQVVTSAEMQRLGLQNVADALRLVNGVAVKDYGGLGGMKTVSVRNLGAEHTGVLYDGIPVSNCQAGQIDISRFSSDNLHSLRMGIGAPTDMLTPASVEPFSGNLYLNTNDRDHYKNIKLSYGSWNTLSASAHIGEDVVHAFLHYSHTDGNYPFILTNGSEQTREHRNNSRVDAINGEVNMSKLFASETNHASSLSSKIYYYYSDRQLPGGITMYNKDAHERLYDENCFAQTRYAIFFGEKLDAQVLFKYNHSWNQYFDGNQLNDGEITMHTYRYRQDETYLSLGANYHVLSSADKLQLSLVIDELWNTLCTNIPETSYRFRTTTYASFRARYHDRRITANASLLYTNLNEDRNQSRFTPSVSLSISPWPEKKMYFRASWRQAFRLPTFNDLYYYRLGNHNLRPERTNEINLGVTSSFSFQDIVLSFTTDAFHNRVHDLIVAFPTTFAWKMYNYGKVDIWGVNFSAEGRYRWLFLNLGYNLNDARNLSSNISGQYSRQVPYTARHSGHASLVCHTHWFDVGYALQWMGHRYSSLMHEPRYRLGSFDDHSITLSRNIRLRYTSFSLSLMCKNLFDRQYDIIQYYPMPGRSFMVEVKFNL
ncbi:MAG: TonB-dependent receptor [Bacteroidales bacterium]|nr:TonB-dependent receptor [Bacteroidales bacterium]